jgi:hypothetical protein
MVKPDILASKLKSEIDSQSTGSGGGSDSMIAKNQFKSSIPANGIANEEIIKKRMKKKTKISKEENKESTGAGSAGGFSAPLFSTTKKEMEEDCWKGYKEVGGKKKNGKTVPNCVPVNESEEEYCDSCDRVKSKCVCGETKKVEATESTGSGSSGSYETTAAWAKSQSKKDWRGKSKTQIPGGKFVQVKKKCQKFPYCNQGDIKALKIFENEKVKKAIKNISERHNISENVIKTIIAYEYENTFSK